MVKHSDIVTIGDIARDLFVQIHDAELLCTKDDNNCQLALSYGSKILADNIHESVGGNAANVGVSTTKLGLSTALLGFVGDDSFGKQAVKTLKSKELDTSHVSMKGKTNQSVIINFQGERTILGHKEQYSYNVKSMPDAEWVFLTSLGPGAESFTKKLLKFYRGKRIIFNPGSHQMRLAQNSIRQILDQVSILILNAEEAATITRLKSSHDFKKVLHLLSDLGPHIVVVTDGKNGAYAHDQKNFYHVPAMIVKVIDPTGAGDAFSAGFVSALVSGEDIKEALRWGIFNSTALIQKLGTEEGMLTKAQIKATSRSSKLVVKEF
jgi:ribokinase